MAHPKPKPKGPGKIVTARVVTARKVTKREVPGTPPRRRGRR